MRMMNPILSSGHRSTDGYSFYHGFNGLDGYMSCEVIRQKPDKPLGEDGGLCPCCYASALVL